MTTTLTEKLLEQSSKDQDTLIELLDTVSDEVVSPLRTALVRVLARAVALWPGDDATPSRKAAALRVIERDLAEIKGMSGTLESALLRALTRVSGEGVASAIAQASIADIPLPKRKLAIPATSKTATRSIEDIFSEQIGQATTLLKRAKTKKELDGALRVAERTVSRTNSTVEWAASDTYNSTRAELIKADKRLALVFQPERNACLQCLSHAGEVNGDSPPIHPHCRCELIVWDQTSGSGLPEALTREANRSIVRGWSAYDSNRARLKAAQALLDRGVVLPKSVKEYGRRSIKLGSFPNGPTPV